MAREGREYGGMGQGSCAANIGAEVAAKEGEGICLAVRMFASAGRPGLQPGGLPRSALIPVSCPPFPWVCYFH